MQKLVITNGGGQYWNGECWGPREAASTYAWEDLPEEIDTGYEVLQLERHEEPWDAGYYASDEEPDASAWTQAEHGG